MGAQLSSTWAVQENKEDMNLKLRCYVEMYASFEKGWEYGRFLVS